MGLSHVLRNPLKRVGILGVWLDQINGLWKNISQRQTLFIENAEKYFEKNRYFAYSSSSCWAKMC